MRKQWFVLSVALLASVALWGCGSGGGSGGSTGVASPDANVAAVGVENCDQCHSATVTEWLSNDGHGNSTGSPSLTYFGHIPTSDCSVCHDPSGEGEALLGTLGEVARPVIGCEECHGGGSAHRGVGAIPYPWPDSEQCADCHDSAHGSYDLATAVDNSAHNNSDDLHASRARCQRCHTTEGNLLLAQYTGNADVIHLMDSLPPTAPEEDMHAVTCAACHDPHTSALRADTFVSVQNSLTNGGVATNWDPNQSGTPDQFDFCTQCHMYWNIDRTKLMTGTETATTEAFYHDDDWYRQITSTHYDDPTTGYGLATNVVEGYVIREQSANPCFDCHNHEFRTNTRYSREAADPADPDLGPTIHTQWASSGHGGRLLPAKYAAADIADADNDVTPAEVDDIRAAGVDSTNGDAWVHYNWDEDGRQGCQECHTSTGAANYLDNPAGYNAAANDFSHLDSWVGATGSPQNELLYCWGCHDNAGTGSLRNPGAITRPYSVSAVAVTIPDVGNSNVCINCHGAQGNMESYAAVTEDPSTDFTALNSGYGGPGIQPVTEAHYLVAAATIYAEDSRIGYEYSQPAADPVNPGVLLNYAPLPYFAHDSVGLNGDSPETGAGPCAACHMETEESHLFEVVTKDGSNVITALNATSCVECHDGSHGTALQVGSAAAAAFLEEEAEGYHEALAALLAAIEAKGILWTGGYPYFDTDGSLGTAATAGSWIDEGIFGAAHNYNYLHHEPGAYAHNRMYAKRLIFDSIDWLDGDNLDNTVDPAVAGADGSNLDGAITIDTAVYPEAAVWYGWDGTATDPDIDGAGIYTASRP